MDGNDSVRKVKYCMEMGKQLRASQGSKSMMYVNPTDLTNQKGIIYSSYLGSSIGFSGDSTKTSNTVEYFSETDSLLETRTDPSHDRW